MTNRPRNDEWSGLGENWDFFGSGGNFFGGVSYIVEWKAVGSALKAGIKGLKQRICKWLYLFVERFCRVEKVGVAMSCIQFRKLNRGYE